MSHYKSESNKSIAERIYSHRVDVTVPPRGLGGRLDAMLEWCRQRGCEWAQNGHRQHEPGQRIIERRLEPLDLRAIDLGDAGVKAWRLLGRRHGLKLCFAGFEREKPLAGAVGDNAALHRIKKAVDPARYVLKFLTTRCPFASASHPSAPEIDLSSWRPEHEVADRPEIERAVAFFVKDLATSANQVDASASYEALVALAPEFLKEFTLKTGLNEKRFWREAVGRVGEVRSDRKTIPLVGSLLLEDNLQRFLSILDYGVAGATEPVERIKVVAPQTRHWGATTQLRGLLSLIKEKIGSIGGEETPSETVTTCIFAGSPPRYVEETFDEVVASHEVRFPRALELYLVPSVAMAAIVHAPIGASTGNTVPLGITSFDPVVLERCERYVEDNRFNKLG